MDDHQFQYVEGQGRPGFAALLASFQQDSWLHLHGGVGYRRASGDRSQLADLAFANSTTTFAVEGAPIADSAVVAELGLSAWLTPRQQLELAIDSLDDAFALFDAGDESRFVSGSSLPVSGGIQMP